MKELSIYLHTSVQSEPSASPKWVNEFTENLKKSLEKFDVHVNLVTSEKEVFFNSIDGLKLGCYLPIINKSFIQSETAPHCFKSVVEHIADNFYKQAFHLSLIEEVLPINQASYQPLYKFFNQGQFAHQTTGRYQEMHLPGNNNIASFKHHIENIAKEISYQLLKLSSSRNSTPKVFIGSTTSDLEEPIKSLYNFLLENNIDVVSPVNPTGLSNSYIEKKVNRIIEQSWLSIHPFGNGSIHPDYYLADNQNLCELENRLASQHFFVNRRNALSDKEFKRIIWIPRKASTSTFEGRLIERISNTANQNGDAEVLDCSLDELKEIILSYNKDLLKDNFVEQPVDSISNLNRGPSLASSYDVESERVFVLFEPIYASVLQDLSDILKKNSIRMITLKDLEGEVDYNMAKNNLLQTCKGVIILASNWNSSWFKSNINEIVKAKSTRVNKKIDFLCVLSREIEQIPYHLQNDTILIRINDQINEELLTTMLFHKNKSI